MQGDENKAKFTFFSSPIDFQVGIPVFMKKCPLATAGVCKNVNVKMDSQGPRGWCRQYSEGLSAHL